MGKLSAQTIVEKADLAVQDLIDDGGYLNPSRRILLFVCLWTSPLFLMKCA